MSFWWIWYRWDIVIPAALPPINFSTKHPYYRVVLGLTFLWFLEKNVVFLNLHYYIMFFRIVQKVDFTNWNPILCLFFVYKKQGSTLRFFQILIRIDGLLISIKIWKKTIIFSEKNTTNGISCGEIDFLNNSDKKWFIIVNSKIMNFYQNLKKSKGYYIVFCKKNDTKWDFEW